MILVRPESPGPVVSLALLLLLMPAGAASQSASAVSGLPLLAPTSTDWRPVGASALLPGAGQFMQGRRRAWVYLAAEAMIWAGWGVERSRGREDRGAYRDLAWSAARFGSADRVDGDWEYYERMSYWLRSGAFDADPAAAGIQPETDPTTFNGDAWRLAADIFLGGGPVDPHSPAYASALAFYVERAYGESFLWDWTGQATELDRYRGLIETSDSHFKRASLILGGVVLNRVVSSLDAFLSQGTGRTTSLRVVPRRSYGGRGSIDPYLMLSIRTP